MKIIKNLWWLNLIIGIFFLSIGLVAIIDSELILSFITIAVGIGFMFSGSKDLIEGLSTKSKDKEWWKHLVYAGVNISLGLLLILQPQTSLVVVLYYLASWAIIRGIIQIFFGSKMPILKNATVTSGLIMAITGIIILLYPEEISEVIITIIGIIMAIIGISQIVQASLTKRTIIDTQPKIKDAIVIEKKDE